MYVCVFYMVEWSRRGPLDLLPSTKNFMYIYIQFLSQPMLIPFSENVNDNFIIMLYFFNMFFN